MSFLKTNFQLSNKYCFLKQSVSSIYYFPNIIRIEASNSFDWPYELLIELHYLPNTKEYYFKNLFTDYHSK